MVAPEPLIMCSKTLQNTFLRVQHPPSRVWGPTCDQVRSGQVVPATTVRQPAKCVRRQDIWQNTRIRNRESRCRFRRNPDAQKGLQPVDEDYLTQRGLQLVGAHLVRQWCVCPSQAAPLTPGGAQGGWRRRQPA